MFGNRIKAFTSMKMTDGMQPSLFTEFGSASGEELSSSEESATSELVGKRKFSSATLMPVHG